MTAAEIVRAIVVAAEVIGYELSAPAAEAMARELAQYDASAVALALRRCCREVTGRLSLVRVLERLPGQHLDADEAWALCPRSEAESVVWTDEISEAFGAARPLLAAGDQVAARLAFRDAYQRLVGESGARGSRPAWYPSLGHDVGGRAPALAAAVACGRLPEDHAAVVGHLSAGGAQPARLPSSASIGELVSYAQWRAEK